MPSLRSHAKDPAIGMTSQANCELIADVLAHQAAKSAHWFFKWLSPYRHQADVLRLLAATFERVKGIPEPLPNQVDARIAISMGEPRYD